MRAGLRGGRCALHRAGGCAARRPCCGAANAGDHRSKAVATGHKPRSPDDVTAHPPRPRRGVRDVPRCARNDPFPSVAHVRAVPVRHRGWSHQSPRRAMLRPGVGALAGDGGDHGGDTREGREAIPRQRGRLRGDGRGRRRKSGDRQVRAPPQKRTRPPRPAPRSSARRRGPRRRSSSSTSSARMASGGAGRSRRTTSSR